VLTADTLFPGVPPPPRSPIGPAGDELRPARTGVLAPGAGGPYIGAVRGNPDYGDKRTRNTRIGPGGGTRRLHQSIPALRADGAETGSTNV